MLKSTRAQIGNWFHRWLFQWRGAEPGEVLLTQRRVFILPTAAGLAHGVLLIVLFLACVNYNLSLGFVLTFLLAGCALIDMHLSFRNLAYLTLSAGRTQPIFAGEEAQFEFHLMNRRNHHRYAIWLGFIGEGMRTVDQCADIRAQTTCQVRLALASTQRGWLMAPRVRLQTWFPLGLVRTWGYWQPDARVLVYPRPEDHPPPLPLHDDVAIDGQGHANPEEFAGVRPYRTGDSMKHLAWRQIAKMHGHGADALVTKHFEGGASQAICLDFSQLPTGMSVDMKLARLTRWVLEAEKRGLAYAFRAGDTRLSAALGPAHQATCLRALALYPEVG